VKVNEIILGDCLEVMKEFPDESVDLIFADPPYNLGKDFGNGTDKFKTQEYLEFTTRWLDECVRLLKPNGSIYVCMGVRFIAHLYMLMDERLLFNGWITWHYTQGMGRVKGFSPRHEDILYFVKGQDYTFNLDAVRIPQKYYRKRNNMTGANPGDVWTFSHVHYCSRERLPHPTQKPEALLHRLIAASSNEGDLVLDPFVGSGTTCKVANDLGRRWIGIEIEPQFVEMARRRISDRQLSLIRDSLDERELREPIR
jgi:site-specific DNA-methyltransferase (adenine-specific)